jgi:hypothetical protein
VRQSTEKQKRKSRHKSMTNRSVNATGRPTPCGQTPEKNEKHRRTKVKQQLALGQATKIPLQPVELECDHGHISCWYSSFISKAQGTTPTRNAQPSGPSGVATRRAQPDVRAQLDV